MLETYKEIRKIQVYYGAQYNVDYREDEIKIIQVNGKKTGKKTSSHSIP